MRIAICEDQPEDAADLRHKLQRFCLERSMDAEVDLYLSAEALQGSDRAFDVLFMDIYLPHTEGTQLVRQLELPSSCQVVFVTSSREHAIEAFHLGATHYLLKPITDEKIQEAMERCLERLNRPASPILLVKTGHHTLPIPMNCIICMEASNKRALIYTDSGIIQTYTPLSTLWEALDPNRFLRPQRSFVVNMARIDSFRSDALTLVNGMEIRLSRNGRSELKQQYQRFLFDWARRGGK